MTMLFLCLFLSLWVPTFHRQTPVNSAELVVADLLCLNAFLWWGWSLDLQSSMVHAHAGIKLQMAQANIMQTAKVVASGHGFFKQESVRLLPHIPRGDSSDVQVNTCEHNSKHCWPFQRTSSPQSPEEWCVQVLWEYVYVHWCFACWATVLFFRSVTCSYWIWVS